MRCIDLMTFFQAQSCLEKVNNYISIRNVENSCKRMGKSEGSVNFADYWFEMVESEKNLKGKYVGQHFCLLSDEDNAEVRNEFWQNQHEKKVAICLIKVDAENSDIKIQNVEQQLKVFLYRKNLENAKIFRTIDNADLILFLFEEEVNKLKLAVDRIKSMNYNNQSMFYSFYSLLGEFKCIEEYEREFLIDDVKPLGEPISGRRDWKKECWCLKQMDILKTKIDENMEEKNRKWASYYQILNQILSLLCQYEQEEKYKDLFYIFYPPMQLFLEQLEKGKRKLRKMSKKQPELKNKIETAVSEFIDSMEILIHHIGSSCANILNADGRNGLPYDIPVKLCMLYLATLHVATKILNNENYNYQFCLSPVAYSLPTTNVFDFGLEPTNRLVRVSVTRQNLYNVHALQAILCHEASHYVGNYRERKKRAGCFIGSCAAILIEMLLPDDVLYEILQTCPLKEQEKSAFIDDWYERKQNIQLYFEEEMQIEIKSKNESKSEEQKYHFAELKKQVLEAIAELLFDKKNRLHLYMNEVNDSMKTQLMVMSEKSYLLDACEQVQKKFHDNLLNVAIGTEIDERVEVLKRAFKEIYADISSIVLLGIGPRDYMENYLLSEGIIPKNESTTNSLINRIAIVYETMSTIDSSWKEKWEGLSEEEFNNNKYLIDLKQRVDLYLKNFSKKAEQGETVDNQQTSEADPFLIKEIVALEVEYSRECIKLLYERMEKPEIKHPLQLLRAIYQQFEFDPVCEKSFNKFFETYDEFIKFFKEDVKKEWNNWNKRNNNYNLDDDVKKCYT